MTSIFHEINVDDSDQRFKMLKEKFKEEIKTRFTCEDYDPILNYVFNFVFESKNSKENSIKEMRELFHDKTEEIMNILWNLTENIYNLNSSTSKDNDLLEEIYKEKNENQPKKFPSQIVNPNAESILVKPYRNSNHHPYENHRDDRRRGGRDYYPRDNYNYRRNDNYHYHNKDFDERGRKNYEVRTMRIGDKQIVIKKKGFNRSRSRSNDKTDRSKLEKDTEEIIYEDRGSLREHSGPREMQPYDKYYYQPYHGERGGYYAPRRFMRGGRYPRYMKPRFMEPRRMFVGKKLGGRNIIKKEISEVESNANVPNLEKTDNNLPISENIPVNHHEEHKQPEADKQEGAKKKQIRCKKWPQCKADNCEFAHPTETCPYFPKCVFGDKCLFIHPNIPCKFGYYCTRVGCSYSHPTGYNPGMYNNMMGGMPQVAWGPPKFKNLKIDYNKKELAEKNKISKPELADSQATIIAENQTEINKI